MTNIFKKAVDVLCVCVTFPCFVLAMIALSPIIMLIRGADILEKHGLWFDSSPDGEA